MLIQNLWAFATQYYNYSYDLGCGYTVSDPFFRVWVLEVADKYKLKDLQNKAKILHKQ
jgi:hypothetical protein